MSTQPPPAALPSRMDAPARPDDVRTGLAMILGRAPRSLGEMQDYLRFPTIAALGEALLRHPDLPARLAALGVVKDTQDASALRRAPDAVAVRDAYELLLRRAPESPAIVAEAMAKPSVLELLRSILGSEEYRNGANEALWLANLRPRPERRAAPPRGARPPRVLVYGAFGNGNLGDAIQAEAVASLLPLLLGRSDAEVAATSWIDRAPFPSAGLTPWPRETIMDGWKLADFDLVLVGGGGMFAPVHFPLGHPSWTAFLQASAVPYAFLGVGVAAGVPKEIGRFPAVAQLLRGAAFATARSREDLDNLRALVPGAEAFPDPVLAAHALGLRQVPARRSAAAGPPLLVVKRPANPAEAEFLEVAARLAAAAPDRIRTLAIEPLVDGRIAQRFPRLTMVTDFDELLAACAESRLVVSARFHGCIAGVVAGVPTLGVGPRKSGDLFAELGCPEAYVGAAAAEKVILGQLPPPRLPEMGPFADRARAACAALRARLRALGVAD